MLPFFALRFYTQMIARTIIELRSIKVRSSNGYSNY